MPLFYENRIPELQLTNENLNDDMERLLEEAELDEEQEKQSSGEFAREYHLITRRRPSRSDCRGYRAPFRRPRLPRQGDDGLHR